MQEPVPVSPVHKPAGRRRNPISSPPPDQNREAGQFDARRPRDGRPKPAKTAQTKRDPGAVAHLSARNRLCRASPCDHLQVMQLVAGGRPGTSQEGAIPCNLYWNWFSNYTPSCRSFMSIQRRKNRTGIVKKLLSVWQARKPALFDPSIHCSGASRQRRTACCPCWRIHAHAKIDRLDRVFPTRLAISPN